MPWKTTLKGSEQVLLANDKQKLEEEKNYSSPISKSENDQRNSDKSLTLLTFDIWTFEHWNIGSLEHLNIKALELWNIGTLEHWNIGTLEH